MAFSFSFFPLNQTNHKFLAASASNHCPCVRKSHGKLPVLHKTEVAHLSPSLTLLACHVLAGKWHLPGTGIVLQWQQWAVVKGQPVAGSGTASLPIPIFIPVQAGRPQMSFRLRVFRQGHTTWESTPRRLQARLPSPPVWVQGRDVVSTGMGATSQPPWLKPRVSSIVSARPGFLCVCTMSPHPTK